MFPIFLTLFFVSVAGIVVLITKKLLQIEKLRIVSKDDVFFIDVPELEDAHYVLMSKIKSGGYMALVITIRVYLLGKYNTKKFVHKAYLKINHFLKKYRKEKTVEESKKEASKFLKIVSDYKKKVNKITEQIKEEEGFEI